MFSIDQIHNASKKVKSGADFPQFVQDLKDIGVRYYDNFVSDGRTCYYGPNEFKLKGESNYSELKVNAVGSADALKKAISIHQNGQTDYPTFCQQASEAGVEKWTTHMIQMTVTYFDKAGNELLVEPIPTP